MIYYVRYSEIEDYLARCGYRRVPSQARHHRLYINEDRPVVVLRVPNQGGLIPEILVDEAFERAGIDPPSWNVQWCD